MSQAPAPQPDPANRLNIDYRDVPRRKLDVPIIDFHTHVKEIGSAPQFFEVADDYGIDQVVSMTPHPDVPALQQKYGERLKFIAVPNFKKAQDAQFLSVWMEELKLFRHEHGAKLAKFWMAPRMRGERGLTLQHPLLRPIIDRTLELGYEFIVHIADPTVWWERDDKYKDTRKYGDKAEQYEQLEWFLELVAPRRVVGAHMGGNIEDPPFLQRLLDRHQNYLLDTSATKWIVREVSRHPDVVRRFVIRNEDRILFGSDIVTDRKFDRYDHYASRYWAHQMLWETDYRGESPIEDPDADPPPLNGVDLPEQTLRKIYRENVLRLNLIQGDGQG